MAHQLVRYPEKVSSWDLWKALAAEPGRIALESGAAGPGTGNWTILLGRPRGRVVFKGDEIHVYAGPKIAKRYDGRDPIAALKQALAWYGGDRAAESTRAIRRDAAKAGFPRPPFLAGAAGWLAYELGRRIRRFEGTRPDADPPLDLGLYGAAALLDVASGTTYLVGMDNAIGPAEAEVGRLSAALDRVIEQRKQDRAAENTIDYVTSPIRGGTPGLPPIADLPALPGRDEFFAAVATVRERVRAGVVGQANVSMRFSAKCRAPIDKLWRRLRRATPEPFMACVQGADRAVLCASMERLFAVREGMVECRPIKGTRPRGETPEDDERAKAELAASVKDRGELARVVAQHREDLGTVCTPSTVTVDAEAVVRTFARVHHLEASLGGTLAPGKDACDALAALFPSASITGTPRAAAMKIVEEVEPQPRGVSFGAIGYLGVDGDADLAVAIRTAVLRKNELHWSAGSAIGADSDPEIEWKELVAKAKVYQELVEATRGR